MTRPVSRRTVLVAGGVGVLGAATAGATGLVGRLTDSALRPTLATPLRQPEELRSRGGALAARLRAATGTHEVAGRQARTLGYNGGVPGPTLRVRPGELLRVRLDNDLDEPTNLHVHGLHVSPEGRGDNVFVVVHPGESREYEIRLPDDHPPGVYWYHPHHHGTVADQVFGGLYGAIVVEEAEPVPVDDERVLVISDISLDGEGAVVPPSRMDRMQGREGDLVLVNGQVEPLLSGRAGQRERWRIVNACSSRYLAPRLSGHRARVVGRDVGRLATPTSLDGLVLAPGNRADLIVDVGEGEGRLTIRAVDRGRMDMGDMGDMGGMGAGMAAGVGGAAGDDQTRVLLMLRGSSGEPVGGPPLPAAPPVRDLRGDRVAGRRTLVFEEDMSEMMRGSGGFTFGGAAFDPDRIDQRASLGTVEEWVIENDTDMDHPFHLHVWPMQVIEARAERLTEPLWLDVVNVPSRERVVVRIPFEDFGGRTVYHCHVLDHEDRGMMGTVLVG